MSWKRLIRFVAEETKNIHLGQPVDSLDIGLAVHNNNSPVKAYEITGDIFTGTVTKNLLTVKSLLSPLESTGAIRCTGLNYIDHANEAKMPIPTDPVLFFKAGPALNGPGVVPIPKICQDESSDYEAELAFIMAKDAKDVKVEDALDYVLGFTASNDISSRKIQLSGSQWCFSKSMDGSCPIGPVLVKPSELDSNKLSIKAIVNGDVVQNGNTKDFIFGVAELIAYFSQGTTLQKGSLVLTGTPAGIGYFRTPRMVLRNGDDMRVCIEGIGTLVNRIEYQ